MNFFRNLSEEVGAFLFGLACIPAMWRQANGRLYVLRNSPQWIVGPLADIAPAVLSDPTVDRDSAALCQSAVTERELRQRRGEWK